MEWRSQDMSTEDKIKYVMAAYAKEHSTRRVPRRFEIFGYKHNHGRHTCGFKYDTGGKVNKHHYSDAFGINWGSKELALSDEGALALSLRMYYEHHSPATADADATTAAVASAFERTPKRSKTASGVDATPRQTTNITTKRIRVNGKWARRLRSCDDPPSKSARRCQSGSPSRVELQVSRRVCGGWRGVPLWQVEVLVPVAPPGPRMF
jgi:hypothetical protein